MIYPSVLGIDPGQTGAITILRSNHVADVISIPFMDEDMDVPYIVSWVFAKTDLKDMKLNTVAYIEKVWRFGRGGPSTGELVRVSGILYGVIRAMDIPVKLVAPATWRKFMFGNFRATKQDALDYCVKYYPDIEFGKDHNKAESVCIAEYGFIQENGSWK